MAAKGIAGIEGSAVLVVLLVSPVISYALLSGRFRLTELRGAGIEAKFTEVSESAVTPHSELIPVEEMVVVEKADPAALREVLEEYKERPARSRARALASSALHELRKRGARSLTTAMPRS